MTARKRYRLPWSGGSSKMPNLKIFDCVFDRRVYAATPEWSIQSQSTRTTHALDHIFTLLCQNESVSVQEKLL
jgi:hypothetical protein